MDRFEPIADDEVQLWRIDLAQSARLLDGAYAVLGAEDRERAGKMRSGIPRDEFVVARGSLRHLLGAVVGENPKDLLLEKGAHGKPRLRVDAGERGMWFNVAHSHGLILIALSTAGEVGVDVEYQDAGVDVEDVARTVFHDDELQRIEAAATEELKLAIFYLCWARKEAVVKADGRGLVMDLKSFAVGPDNGSEVEVELPTSRGGELYFVRGIDVGGNHAAAVALPRRGLSLRYRDLPKNFFDVG